MSDNTISSDERLAALERENAYLKDQIQSISAIAEASHRLQQEYQESQVRFRTIFEESPFGNKIINSDLIIIKINKEVVRILGFPEEEIVGRKIIEFSHPDSIEEWEKLRRELWAPGNTRSSFTIEACLVRKDKTIIWCQVTSILFADDDQRLGYTVIDDITIRKEAERVREQLKDKEHSMELLRMQQQQQRELFEITTKSQERERIAEQLHNSLGQMLFAVKMSLNRLRDRTAEQQENLRQTEDLLSKCIVECRQISHNLHPSVLRDFGLQQAIREVSQQFEGQLDFQCKFNGLNKPLDKYLEIVVFRIFQELALNIVKHAQASKATCTVNHTNERISLTVEDNGIGFQKKDKKDGLGISAIRHRVQLMQGTVAISSEQGRGTKITIDLPLERKEE